MELFFKLVMQAPVTHDNIIKSVVKLVNHHLKIAGSGADLLEESKKIGMSMLMDDQKSEARRDILCLMMQEILTLFSKTNEKILIL